MTRRKERRFYSFSVTLTMEQIEWLRNQSNSSELIRELVDKAMGAGKQLEIAALDKRIKSLWEQWRMLTDVAPDCKSEDKRDEYARKAQEVMKEIGELEDKKEELERLLQR